MAKKADLIAQAKKLGLTVTPALKVADLETMIAKHSESKTKDVKGETKDGNNKEDNQTEHNEVDQTEKIEENDSEAGPQVKESVKPTKAGKKSAKSLAEAEEKAAKEARKEAAADDESVSAPKVVQITRSKLERAGKKLRKASELVDIKQEYSTKNAIELAIKTATTKFDSTVELHVRLGVDPRQADQNIRETLVLPSGTGKVIRVAVFGDAEDVAKAKKAGADIAGSDEFLQQLDKGIIDFDVLIATPLVMAKLGKYARVLGPKGLMPNPKSGTVTTDVAKAVEQSKAGKVEFRVDEYGIVHLGVGKASFGADKIYDNVVTVFTALKASKPSSIKGNYVRSIYLTTTMGPSIRVLTSEL